MCKWIYAASQRSSQWACNLLVKAAEQQHTAKDDMNSRSGFSLIIRYFQTPWERFDFRCTFKPKLKAFATKLLVQYSGSIKNEVYVNFTRNLIHNVIFVTYPHPLAQSNRLVEVWYTYSKQGSAISTLTIHGYSLVLKLCLNYVPKIFRCSDITTSRHGTVSTDLSDSKWRVRGLHDPA